MSSAGDFIIVNGVLERYKGPGGDVTIPESVTSIGNQAFHLCDSVTSVTIPANVTSIGDRAFLSCRNLLKVTILDGVTRIGDGAFQWCRSLTSVTIPDSVTSIGDGVFENCGSLTSVTIRSGVTSIGNWAFKGCTSLTSVTIPEGVSKIGNQAFSDCRSLTNVTIPEGVRSIGSEEFYRCGLTGVTIPKSVTSIGAEAFLRCKGLADKDGFVIVNDILFDYNGSGGDVTIPSGVTSIGVRAFSSCGSLTSVTIPEGVRSICSEAFYKCGLKSVTIPGSVTRIGNQAFEECSSLTSVTIRPGVTSIGSEAFKHCGSLTSVSIPESMTSIGDRAFWNCGSLTNITIPASVRSIGELAFYRCGLTSVTIPASVTNIGAGAFLCCKGLSDKDGFVIVNDILLDYTGSGGDVTIPEGVTSISGWTFEDCQSLTGVTIPESVTSIGGCAFEDCHSLTSVTIPEGVTSIGDWAFKFCSSLTSVTIPEGVTSVGYRLFFGCGALQSIILSDSAFRAFLAMKDREFKESVLEQNVWRALDSSWQGKFYLARQGKSLTEAYLNCIQDEMVSPMGEAILKQLGGKASARECSGAADYMTLFCGKAPEDLLRRLYSAIKAEKNGKKAAAAVEECRELTAILRGPSASGDGSAEDPFVVMMRTRGISAKEAEIKLKSCYDISFAELPDVRALNGEKSPAAIIAWLLMAHETCDNSDINSFSVAWQKPGPRPEAAEVVALLDREAFQQFLLKLTDAFLVKYEQSNKIHLSYPVCRYADENTMAELTKRAPEWATVSSGNDAPLLRAFRGAAVFSDTRAAMIFAEKMGDLDKYAALRGTTGEELRDKYLSDVGLDEQGGKTYDLGIQTVTARLQKDLSFLFELPGGKTAKSLPRKGADPAKYEAAKADFDELRKSVKKILKNRSAVLFEDFLSGRERQSGAWREAFLKNTLLRAAAGLLVWEQGGKTFTLSDAGPVDSAGQPYAITDEPIRVAHPMEMTPEDVKAWQQYFAARGLKQPFAQIWEHVIDLAAFKKDRYAGCMIPYYRFAGQEKHGVTVLDRNFHDDIIISFSGCDADVERIDWGRHSIDRNHRFEIRTLTFDTFTRRTNHLLAYLDRVAVWERVRKDDESVMTMMDVFTLAQITEFIRAAREAKAMNVLALLLDYKNARFPDFDPMDEFTLDW